MSDSTAVRPTSARHDNASLPQLTVTTNKPSTHSTNSVARDADVLQPQVKSGASSPATDPSEGLRTMPWDERAALQREESARRAPGVDDVVLEVAEFTGRSLPMIGNVLNALSLVGRALRLVRSLFRREKIDWLSESVRAIGDLVGSFPGFQMVGAFTDLGMDVRDTDHGRGTERLGFWRTDEDSWLWIVLQRFRRWASGNMLEPKVVPHV